MCGYACLVEPVGWSRAGRSPGEGYGTLRHHRDSPGRACVWPLVDASQHTSTSHLISYPPFLTSACTLLRPHQPCALRRDVSLKELKRFPQLTVRFSRHGQGDYDDSPTVRAAARDNSHLPTRPVDKEKNESELSVHIKKATSAEETAPSESLVLLCRSCADNRAKACAE